MNKLKGLVLLRIDEYSEDFALNEGDFPIADVEAELTESAKAVSRIAPREVMTLSSKAASSGQDGLTIHSPENRGTIIELPEDYLRFLSLKMKGWKRVATNTYPDTSILYEHQVYEKRRGTSNNPMVFTVPHAPGENGSKRGLEVFPVSDAVENLIYVPYATVETIPEELHDLVAWKAVVSVLLIMKEYSGAKAATQKEQQALQEVMIGAGRVPQQKEDD